MKTKMFQTVVNQLWRKCIVAGAKEIGELRARSGPRCPHCGGQLILRRIGFGRDAGKQFWDCSNVPRCSLSIAAEEVTWPEPTSTLAAAAAVGGA